MRSKIWENQTLDYTLETIDLQLNKNPDAIHRNDNLISKINPHSHNPINASYLCIKMKNGYLKYSSMAFQMGVTIGLFAFAGYKLDEHFKTMVPYFTIGLSLIGVGLSLFSVIKDFIKPHK